MSKTNLRLAEEFSSAADEKQANYDLESLYDTFNISCATQGKYESYSDFEE